MPESFHVETFDKRDFTPDAAAPIAELLCLVWPKPGRTIATRVAQMSDEMRTAADAVAPRGFLVRESRQVIAFAQILPRTVGTTKGDLTVAGLARVCVHPEHRGRGLGEVVVRAALEPVDRGEFAWSLFQTSTDVQPFYEKLGAAVTDNRIVNSLGDDPDANPFWDSVVMRYPAKQGWPPGTIDLRGPGY